LAIFLASVADRRGQSDLSIVGEDLEGVAGVSVVGGMLTG
jgi:hypothetical protein